MWTCSWTSPGSWRISSRNTDRASKLAASGRPAPGAGGGGGRGRGEEGGQGAGQVGPQVARPEPDPRESLGRGAGPDPAVPRRGPAADGHGRELALRHRAGRQGHPALFEEAVRRSGKIALALGAGLQRAEPRRLDRLGRRGLRARRRRARRRAAKPIPATTSTTSSSPWTRSPPAISPWRPRSTPRPGKSSSAGLRLRQEGRAELPGRDPLPGGRTRSRRGSHDPRTWT